MFTTAVVGPPLPEPPASLLISDALTDTLRVGDGGIRMLVPITNGSLTAGVRAVVEWAWGVDETTVIAVHDGTAPDEITPGGELEEQFIATGADETILAVDVVGSTARALLDALPNACLLVALGDQAADIMTKQLIDLAYTSGVPVYDVCGAGIPVSPHDVTGWENSEPEPVVEEEESREPEKAKLAVGLVPARTREEELALALREERRGWVHVEKVAAEHINGIDDQLNHGKPPRKPGHNGILISYDGGKTMVPRGRGKAKRNSIEYDAETLQVIRDHRK